MNRESERAILGSYENYSYRIVKIAIVLRVVARAEVFMSKIDLHVGKGNIGMWKW